MSNNQRVQSVIKPQDYFDAIVSQPWVIAPVYSAYVFG